jgi:predicted MFS family arabinose efflux permease
MSVADQSTPPARRRTSWIAFFPRMEPSLWLLCCSFFLVFLGAGAFQQFITPYLLTAHRLGGDTSSAVLATVYLAAFICLTFTTYNLAWLGEFTALVLGTIAYTLFAVAALISGSLVILLLAAALWGWGSSVLWTAGTAFVLDLADQRTYGRSTGMLYTGVFIGQALGVLLLGALVGLIGPRGMVATVVAITMLGTLAALFLPRTRQRRASPTLLNPFTVLQNPMTRTAALILLLSSSGYGLLLGTFSRVVSDLYGLAAVGWITAGFYVARIPASSSGGWLIDRWGCRAILRIVFLITGATLLLAALLHHPAVLAICAAALGIQAAIVPVGLTAWVGGKADAANRPASFAAIQLWFNVGTGLAILGGGRLLSLLGGWQGSFIAFALIFAACATLAARLA